MMGERADAKVSALFSSGVIIRGQVRHCYTSSSVNGGSVADYGVPPNPPYVSPRFAWV